MPKKQKKYKTCPECGGILESVHPKKRVNGVEYDEDSFLECQDCGYKDTKKSKKNRIAVRDWNME